MILIACIDGPKEEINESYQVGNKNISQFQV